MTAQYTAVVKQDGDWWIGWIEEVPGVNCREHTREALLSALQETPREALEFNRQQAIQAAGKNFVQVLIAVEDDSDCSAASLSLIVRCVSWPPLHQI